MTTSPLSLSGLINELLADQEDPQQPSPRTATGPSDAKQEMNLPQLASDDSVLAGLLEGLDDMEQSELVQGGGIVIPSLADRAAAGRIPFSLAKPVCEIQRPWTAAEGSRVAAVVSLAQDQNSGFRDYMEDGSRVCDPFPVRGCGPEETWALFAVYDGHGGREATDYCESRVHQQVLAELHASASDQEVGRALAAAFQKIDSQLAMYGAWGHGCTATVALAHWVDGRGSLHVANVGDSRAVFLDNNGARRLSVDHRPDDASEARRVVRDGGRVVDKRVGGDLAISRSLGDHRLKGKGLSCEPSVSSCVMAHGHCLIIASDGLWDVISDSDACSLLESCVERASMLGLDQMGLRCWLQDNAAQELVDRAKQLGSEDNLLVLTVFF